MEYQLKYRTKKNIFGFFSIICVLIIVYYIDASYKTLLNC